MKNNETILIKAGPEEPWECQAIDCDLAWEFTDGGLAENRMFYCPYCGRKIIKAIEEGEGVYIDERV